MKHRSTVTATAFAAIAIAVLGGCSGGSSDEDVSSLTMWISTSTAQQEGYDALAADYEAATGVSVDIVNIPYDGFDTKVLEAAQADDLPDVARVASMDPTWLPKTVDLSSIASNADYGINSDLIVTAEDGTVPMIPSDVTSAGLFVNKSLFDEAGVEYPTTTDEAWTWDEFVAAADQVREKTGAKYDLVFDNSSSRLRAYLYSKGATFLQQADDGSFSIDAASATALQEFVDMNDDTVMPKSVWTSGADPNALFKSGQVVAYFSGVWQTSDFDTNITDFEWASASTPADPTHATEINYGGLTVAFDNGDAQAEAAKAFVDYMYQPDNYSKLCVANGMMPVETGLDLEYTFETDAAKESMALYVAESEVADPISTYFAKKQTEWSISSATMDEEPTKDVLAEAITGKTTVAAALEEILAAYESMNS